MCSKVVMLLATILVLSGSALSEVITYEGNDWQIGPCRDMTWYEAKDWAEGLSGSWRLPTVAEFQGLYDSGINAWDMGPFVHEFGSSRSIWTCERTEYGKPIAFNFRSGQDNFGDADFPGIYAFAIRD